MLDFEKSERTLLSEPIVIRRAETPVMAGDTHSVILHLEGHDADAGIT